MNLSQVFVGALVALVAGMGLAPFVFKMLQLMKSRQTISQHIQEHAHKQGTPTMGGIMILIALAVGMVASWRDAFLAPLVLLMGFGAVGFLDDYLMPKWKPGSRGLGWMPKLGLEIGAAILATVFMGWGDPLLIGFFVFMVLFMSNAYNFSDGLDGLAGGLGLILSLGLAALAFFGLLAGIGAAQNVLPPVVGMMILLAISFVPFLFFNAPPARVFMGDVGALPIGALLGWAVSLCCVVQPLKGSGPELSVFMMAPVVVMLGVMLVEIVPVPLQIASVKIRKKRLFNFKTPVHHAFQEKGWPETRIVWMFHLVQVSLVLAGLVLFFVIGEAQFPENFGQSPFVEQELWGSHR